MKKQGRNRENEGDILKGGKYRNKENLSRQEYLIIVLHAKLRLTAMEIRGQHLKKKIWAIIYSMWYSNNGPLSMENSFNTIYKCTPLTNLIIIYKAKLSWPKRENL